RLLARGAAALDPDRGPSVRRGDRPPRRPRLRAGNGLAHAAPSARRVIGEHQLAWRGGSSCEAAPEVRTRSVLSVGGVRGPSLGPRRRTIVGAVGSRAKEAWRTRAPTTQMGPYRRASAL